MPQLDPSSFVSQLFWLFVTFSILYAILSSSVLPKIHDALKERHEHLDNDLSKAAKAKESARIIEDEYKNAILEARNTSTSLVANAHLEIKKKLAESVSELDKDLLSKAQKSELAFQAEVKKATLEVAKVTEAYARIVAEKLLGTKIDENKVKAHL